MNYFLLVSWHHFYCKFKRFLLLLIPFPKIDTNITQKKSTIVLITNSYTKYAKYTLFTKSIMFRIYFLITTFSTKSIASVFTTMVCSIKVWIKDAQVTEEENKQCCHLSVKEEENKVMSFLKTTNLITFHCFTNLITLKYTSHYEYLHLL